MNWRERVAERLFGEVIEARVRAAVKVVDNKWWEQVGGAAGPQDKRWWELRDDFEDALKALTECEKPVVVHCQGGRDRTMGLVGVYKREVLKASLYDIYHDGCIYGTPGECWLLFFQVRL